MRHHILLEMVVVVVARHGESWREGGRASATARSSPRGSAQARPSLSAAHQRGRGQGVTGLTGSVDIRDYGRRCELGVGGGLLSEVVVGSCDGEARESDPCDGRGNLLAVASRTMKEPQRL
jgi:hypothetical protein